MEPTETDVRTSTKKRWRKRKVKHQSIRIGTEEKDCGGKLKKKDRTASESRFYSFMCDICGKKCRRNRDLEYHMNEHTGEKPYKCRFCNRRFVHEDEATTHQKNHKLYVCHICGLNCRIPRDLHNHLTTHTGERPFGCSYCQKRFSRPDHVKKHERIHTGEKPYNCEYCNRSFARKESKIQHERTHTGEKPYKCEHCDMRFGHYGNMKDHQRTHTGEKLHKCSICETGFSRANFLQKHMLTHIGETARVTPSRSRDPQPEWNFQSELAL